MNIKIPINENKSYLAVLKILNFLTGMTELELGIIATMLSNNIVILTKESRGLLRSLLPLEAHSLNNHIKRLKEKKVLLPNNKDLEINPNLLNTVYTVLEDQKVEFELCL